MSAGLEIYNSVLNQLGSPAIYSDVFANRPAAGYTGRLFVSTDTNELYRDTGTSWVLIGAGGGGGGITSLNGLNASSQIFSTASTGSDFSISSSGFTHTFAIPSASATARGLVTTAAQTFAGQKTFNTSTIIGSQTANTSHILSPGTSSLAWTGSSFGIGSTIPANTVIINPSVTFSSFTGQNSTIVGYNSGANLTTGNNNVMLGTSVGIGITTGGENVILGFGNANDLPNGLFRGIHLISSYRNNSAALIPSTKHVFIGGGFDVATAQTTYYFGQMPFTADAASVGITFHAPSGTGTDITGASYTEAAGRNTGNGNGGQFNIATSTPGASGTTLGTLTNRIQVSGNGAFIGIHQTPSTQAVAITGDTIVNNGYIQAADNYASIGSGGTYAIFSNNTATYQNAFTTNSGVVYSSLVSSEIKNLNTGTIDAGSFVNSGFAGLYANFAAAASTVTSSQASGGVRSVSALHLYRQIRSTSTTGTFTHLSGLHINGLENSSASSITVTNGYGIIINSLTEFTGTATFTNRWGIYQEGTLDNNYFAGSVNIGSATLNASALLAITSTSQGFLLPRMTDTQKTAISTPANGLMVYDTVNLAPSYYNGTSWVNLGTGGGGGGITSLNGLTGATQTFATATTGTDFTITSTGTVHTFALPDASQTARGVVSIGTQTFNGEKTIRGVGSTSATFALKVVNSASANILQCRNDQTVLFNTWNGDTIQPTVNSGGASTAGFTIGVNNALVSGGRAISITAATTASSGSSDITYQIFTGTINTTATSTSIVRSIWLNHTFTSVTGSYRGLDILAPATLTGGGTVTYLQCRTSTADIFVVQPTTITIGDAVNIAVNTTTGTKIGTSTSQKLSLWNATPIAQPTTAVGSATYASPGAGSTVKTDDTFDGYTLQQVVKALRNIGILA